MKKWLLTCRGALLSAEVIDGQSTPSWATVLWQEAPGCRSRDNPTGTGRAELYRALGPGYVVPQLSGRLSSQLPDLSATSTWDSWPSFIFHGISCWAFSTTNSSPVTHPPCQDARRRVEEDKRATS